MTYRFPALITKEDDWYVARCPELSVTSQGKDVESARANLREAIELYFETWGGPDTLPAYTGLLPFTDLLADPVRSESDLYDRPLRPDFDGVDFPAR